jgi:hypothetical protein
MKLSTGFSRIHVEADPIRTLPVTVSYPYTENDQILPVLLFERTSTWFQIPIEIFLIAIWI